MLKIISEINTPLMAPFDTLNTMFIDIETDGLSHKNTLVIIGLIQYKANKQKAQVIQLFNDDYHSEREMLHHLIQLINEHNTDYFISFNGNAFDIPFLNARFNHYKIDFALNKVSNVDLLRLAKSNSSTLGLTDFKLKTIEKFVGINREDMISGKESIIMYHAFIETQSEAIKETILLHNYDDLINMIPLLKLTQAVTNFLNPFEVIFKRKWYISNISIKGSALYCALSLNARLSITEIYYDSKGAQFECSERTGTFKIDLLQFKDSSKTAYFFADPRISYNSTFETLNDSEKNQLLVSKNGLLIPSNIHSIVFKTIDQILKSIIE